MWYFYPYSSFMEVELGFRSNWILKKLRSNALSSTFFYKVEVKERWGISFEYNLVTSKILLGLSTICQSIKILEINYCKEDSESLISFIEVQSGLQSLFLHFDSKNSKNRYPLLNNAIKKKTTTLKKIMITPVKFLIPVLFQF